MDIYGTNDNFGTADDLKDLSDALHERDMVRASYIGALSDLSSLTVSILVPYG